MTIIIRAQDYAKHHKHTKVVSDLQSYTAAASRKETRSWVTNMRLSNRAFTLACLRSMRDAFEQLCEQASTPLREAADEHGLSDSAALARLGPPYEKDLHPQSSDWERRLHMFYDENRAELCETGKGETELEDRLNSKPPSRFCSRREE